MVKCCVLFEVHNIYTSFGCKGLQPLYAQHSLFSRDWTSIAVGRYKHHKRLLEQIAGLPNHIRPYINFAWDNSKFRAVAMFEMWSLHTHILGMFMFHLYTTYYISILNRLLSTIKPKIKRRFFDRNKIKYRPIRREVNLNCGKDVIWKGLVVA
jgi:hypothetical protein